MAFGKKDHIVGLDIGSRSIKAAEITETKRGLSLTRFGVVDIAQRGRSLGMHLMLATQKPGGVITPNIQASRVSRRSFSASARKERARLKRNVHA